MEKLNLKTTLNAYPKLSPSLLSNYVTKEDFTTTLEGYVEEAPVDNGVYARQNETWVSVDPEIKITDELLYYGANTDLQMDDVNNILSLECHDIIPHGGSSYILNYNQTANGYLWICCTKPIKSIVWGAMGGMIADYIKQRADIVTQTTTYYCYRIRDMLVPGQQIFLLNF